MKKLGLTITLTTNKVEELYSSSRYVSEDNEQYNLNVCFMINDYTGEKRNSTEWLSNDFLFSDNSDARSFSALISVYYSLKLFNDISSDGLQKVLSVLYKEYNSIKFDDEAVGRIIDEVRENDNAINSNYDQRV